MIPKSLNEIAEADIQELKEAGIEEGKTMEYKRELPGTREEEKREFLADVSSFANTEGGDAIYGVDEDLGVITEIVGLSSPDFDAEILRLENLIRDGISPRISTGIRIVPCASGKLLVIRIEKSWIGPHRVIFRGHDKFYARTSAGKFPLDVTQLRTAFLQSATISEQVNGFRLDRIIDIANDRGPIPLAQDPTLVLHIIPLGALSEQVLFDVTPFYRNPALHFPLNALGCSRRMTFDGAMLYAPEDANGRVTSYSHFFRNGIFEAAATSLLETRQVRESRLIPHVFFEEHVINYLPNCFQSLQHIGVRPPASIALTLIRVRGLRMMGAYDLPYGNEIREETLIVPGTIVESFSTPANEILRPMFDRIWNACGLLQSPNFDAKGNWAPRRL